MSLVIPQMPKTMAVTLDGINLCCFFVEDICLLYSRKNILLSSCCRHGLQGPNPERPRSSHGAVCRREVGNPQGRTQHPQTFSLRIGALRLQEHHGPNPAGEWLHLFLLISNCSPVELMPQRKQHPFLASASCSDSFIIRNHIFVYLNKTHLLI